MDTGKNSDLNNLQVVTTTSEQYEESFGFTEEEVLVYPEFSGQEKVFRLLGQYQQQQFGKSVDPER